MMKNEKNKKEECEVVTLDPKAFRETITTITGKKCPTCGKVAKYYHRKLNYKQCLALLHIMKWYRHDESQPNELDFFNINEMFLNNPKLKTDFPKLLYWDLIEHKGRMELKGKRNPKEVFVVTKGMFRISENGIKFAQRETAVPMTAVVYNGVVEAHILHPYKTIEEVLQDAGYDYETIIKPDYFIDL